MSKIFYRGTPDIMRKYDYTPWPQIKLGRANNHLTITVISDERKCEIEIIIAENYLVATIAVIADQEENIFEL